MMGVSRLAKLITIDRSSPVPLYFQVASRLEDLIVTGELAPGARLDNEIALADELGLSRPTMRQAIAHLVNRGMLVRKRGVGTQVVRAQVHRKLQLTSLYEDLAAAHRNPRTEVLGFDLRPASEQVATALNIEPRTIVVFLERLRYSQGEPLALLRNYLPEGLVNLTEDRLAENGLYAILRESGVNPHLADQSIGARKATAGEARLLTETRGAPLLTMTRIAYDHNGRPIEYGTHVYRASRYTFELTLMAH